MSDITVNGVTYRQQYRKCGKAECRCVDGDPYSGEGMHGPYWYADGTKYVGKELPQWLTDHLALLETEKDNLKELKREISERSEYHRSDCVYILKCRELYKIGRTGDLANRIKSLRTGNPFEIQIIHTITSTGNISKIEEALHLIFSDSRTQGEWFNLSLRDLARIKSMSVQGILSEGARIKAAQHVAGQETDPNQMTFEW